MPRYTETRTRRVSVPPSEAWRAVRRGGGRGTGLTALAWRARDTADRLVGGPGAAWRVAAEEPPRRLALVAVARLPGRATLELLVEPDGTGSLLTQTNTFEPGEGHEGLAGSLLTAGGRAYWHALAPAHRLVFARMLGDVARLAERGVRDDGG